MREKQSGAQLFLLSTSQLYSHSFAIRVSPLSCRLLCKVDHLEASPGASVSPTLRKVKTTIFWSRKVFFRV